MANNAGAILVVGRGLVIVPKLIHPLPPPLHSPETSPERVMDDTWMQVLTCVARAKLNVSTPHLSSYMRGKHRDLQERVYEFFKSRPDLQTPIEISKDEHKEICMRQLLGLVREAGIRPFKYVPF